MNDINNLISEELSKMSQLFHHQRGRVISEQTTDVGVDVGQMMRQLDATNTNEDAVLNIIKKYKKNQDFQNFVNQYKKITNKDFGTHLYTAINPSNDKKEWNDLKTYLATLGITLEAGTTNKGRSGIAIFKGIGSAPAAVKDPNAKVKTDETAKIKNIGYAWCREKDGIINWPGSAVDKMKWADYLTKYAVTEPQLTQAKKMCPQKSSTNVVSNKVNSTPKVKRGNTQNLSTLTQDVQKSIGGTPSGKFSSQELDSILQRLGGNDVKSEVSQGTQTTQSFPTDASGKPDLDKILASLSQ
jgi:hypothetical protein